QDDSYLSPRNSAEFKLYTLSQESGRSAAKYFVNTNPKFFTKDFAEPHIPCLMPETVSLRLEEVSEEALKERISLSKVTAAVDMYDQLLQAGECAHTHTHTHILCLYSNFTQSEQPGEEAKRRKGRFRHASDFMKTMWRENNNAERIFNLLPERDTRCYSALIRGMVKHGAYAKAFSMYTDLLNNRLTADVHIFNVLISAAPDVREKYNERWDLIADLLNQMSQQKVWPNLLTFNSVLKALRRCGPLARTQALLTLNEMKALLCIMEHIDEVLKWYRLLIPSLYYPNPQSLRDLFQALDTDSRLDLLPAIWKDIRSLGHDNKLALVEEVLSLMARDEHSPEVQESLAVCALDVKSVFDGDKGRPGLEWSTSSLTHITSLLLKANKTQQAWEMLQIFKAKNRVPSERLLNNFLSVCRSDGSCQRAVDLVQLSAAFCLPATSVLAKQVLAEFDLTEEQRYNCKIVLNILQLCKKNNLGNSYCEGTDTYKKSLNVKKKIDFYLS
uniref:Small ribosomal subunit protein mS39 n=1 Tax=Mastacembelus armatus TaxID=205130 RepID=A0A7N8YM63_9TELE